MKVYRVIGEIARRSDIVVLPVQCPHCGTYNNIMSSQFALKGQMLCVGCMIPGAEFYDPAFEGDTLCWEVYATDSQGRDLDVAAMEQAIKDNPECIPVVLREDDNSESLSSL